MMPIHTYQDVMDLLQATRSLCFVFFNSDPDDDLPGDIPIAIAYIDDEPDGSSVCDSEGIVVSKTNPDWPRIRERVSDILSAASRNADKIYVLLDWEKSLNDEFINKQLTELFRPVGDQNIDNFILPPRIQAFFAK